MSHSSFQVVYDGPALAGSLIDVRDLAPALLAFGDVIEQANATINDGQAKVTLKVSASFKSGCFGIDFAVVQGLLDQALDLFKGTPIASAKELMDYLGFFKEVGSNVVGAGVGLIALVKWLRNRKIKEVVLLDNGNVKIVVADGESIETERRTLDLLRNFKLRQALEQAITEPLDRDGYESVALTTDAEKGFVIIQKTERSYFRAPPEESEDLLDQTDSANLQLMSVSFKEDNKWRFSDGSNTFAAAITDAEFLNRVSLGVETFAAGDIMNVRLRRRQWLAGSTIRSEYEVVEVVSHRKAMVQIPMLLRPENPDETV